MSKISLWKGFNSLLETITIDDFLNRIKYGHWKKETEHIRSLNTDAQKEAKKKILAATVSGVFPNRERNESSLISHSGYLCVDIDNQALEAEQLKNDPYTYAYFFLS